MNEMQVKIIQQKVMISTVLNFFRRLALIFMYSRLRFYTGKAKACIQFSPYKLIFFFVLKTYQLSLNP